MKKAHVVNINFTDLLQRTIAEEHKENQGKFNSKDISNVLKSKQANEGMFELLKIMCQKPSSFRQLLQSTQNRSRNSQQFSQGFQQSPSAINEDQIIDQITDGFTQIVPNISQGTDHKSLSQKSIQMEKAKSINVSSQQASQRNLLTNVSKTEHKPQHSNQIDLFQNLQEQSDQRFSKTQAASLFQKKQKNPSQEDSFYLIPHRLGNLLISILKEFISYKIHSSSNSFNSSKAVSRNIDKRKNIPSKLSRNTTKEFYSPKVHEEQCDKNTQPMICSVKKKNFQTTALWQRKGTSKTQNRSSTNLKTSKSNLNDNGFSIQNLYSHLNENAQMGRQIGIKDKKIAILENELFQYHERLKQKNLEIKELVNREKLLQKKYKSGFDRIMRGKILCDIKEKFQQNYLTIDPKFEKENRNVDPAYRLASCQSVNILQLNGKKYARPQEMNIFASHQYSANLQSDFITSYENCSNNFKDQTDRDLLKPISKQKQQFQHEVSLMSANENLLKKKNNFLKRCSFKSQQQSLNRSDIVKLSRWYDQLNKQITKYEAEKDGLLEKLAENNSRVEKHLSKIEVLIGSRKAQIDDCMREINKIKEQGS